MTRTIAYVDGESHFHRSEEEWQRIHGRGQTLESVACKREAGASVLLIREASVFWSTSFSAGIHSTVYYTAASGDQATLHGIKAQIRRYQVEPAVLQEKKRHRKNRANTLEEYALIEKPKGVDLSLTVRVFSDAVNDLFDRCHLYTSDADFLPLIRAVQARGKQVSVFGYSNGMSTHSHFDYEPHEFIDLGEVLRSEFGRSQSR